MRNDIINVPNISKLVELVYSLKMNGIPFTIEMCEDGSATVTVENF